MLAADVCRYPSAFHQRPARVPAPQSHRYGTGMGSLSDGMIGLLDRHIAAVDVVAKFFQSRRIIQNEIVDLVGFFQTPIRDLNRQLHDYLNTNRSASR